MKKIFTIISREYNTRVRKKSFLIMSIVGPILFAGLMVAPAYFAQMEDTEEKIIAVVDSTYQFLGYFPETEYIKFEYMPDANLNKYKETFFESKYYGILFIQPNVVTPKYGSNDRFTVKLYSDKSAALSVQMHISNAMEKKLEHEKLMSYGIDKNVIENIKSNISVKSVKMYKSGEEKESDFNLAMILGYFVGFMIYFTIFFSGSQVMRGVIEEKTSRIVEVIVSSVKPFQLMLGKIIGVGAVALTQFGIWIIFTAGIYFVAAPLIMPDVAEMSNEVKIENFIDSGSSIPSQEPIQEEMTAKIMSVFGSLGDVSFGYIIVCFLFFFFGGYFLYGSMFAAIGSAVDNEADTQQFMLPVTIPMILAMVVMINVVQNPESTMAMWFSIIPFTSPIVMMARIPFGVPVFQLVISMILLVVTFVFMTWLAGKIYRTGILMYGKKIGWKELWKWIRYSN